MFGVFLNYFFLCCSIRQQYKMAKYCEDILDDYLLKRPLDNSPACTQQFRFIYLAIRSSITGVVLRIIRTKQI